LTLVLLVYALPVLIDTLLLTNGEKVRLIGADTPETKHPKKCPTLWERSLFTHQEGGWTEKGLT